MNTPHRRATRLWSSGEADGLGTSAISLAFTGQGCRCDKSLYAPAASMFVDLSASHDEGAIYHDSRSNVGKDSGQDPVKATM